jgi:hypothetical protein
MEEAQIRQANPALKEIVVEASRALARLDAARLDELARSCQALTLAPPPVSAEGQKRLARQAREAESDMAVFGRVLEATRANLKVMNRLREMRLQKLEYTERQARGGICAEASRNSGFWGKSAEDERGNH